MHQNYNNMAEVDFRKMSVIERLAFFAESKGKKLQWVESTCGFPYAYLKHLLYTQKSIQGERIEKILITFPELSAEWLLRGSGTMIIGEGYNKDQLFESWGLPKNTEEIIARWRELRDASDLFYNKTKDEKYR